jgi:hypothetical protein
MLGLLAGGGQRRAESGIEPAQMVQEKHSIVITFENSIL